MLSKWGIILLIIFLFCISFCDLRSHSSTEISKEKKECFLKIYKNNLFSVKENRVISLKNGWQTIKVCEFPSSVITDSIFMSFNNNKDGIRLTEQNIINPIDGTNDIYEQYIGYNVQIELESSSIKGVLISHKNDIVVAEPDNSLKIVPLSKVSSVKVIDIMKGCSSFPQIDCKIFSSSSIDTIAEINYLSEGITWEASYNGVISNDHNSLAFNGWITINNHSGLSYNNTKIKAIDGIISLKGNEKNISNNKEKMPSNESNINKEIEKAFDKQIFSYDEYIIDKPLNLDNNSVKEIALLETINPLFNKVFRVNLTSMNKKVKVYYDFLNNETNKIGKVLPKGLLRLYKRDNSDSLQLISEDTINQTRINNNISLPIGEVNDIYVNSKRIDFKTLTDKNYTATYEITVNNTKKEQIIIYIDEYFHDAWKLLNCSEKLNFIDLNTIEFELTLNAETEKIIRYTINSSW